MKRALILTGMVLTLASCAVQTTPGLMAPSARSPVQAQRAVANQPGLANHILYFDTDGDRRITLSESRKGLHDLGLGHVYSTVAALILNPILAKQSTGKLGTVIAIDPLLQNFKPTTTGIFGAQGRFMPARFEEVFSRADADRNGALDGGEIERMLKRDLIEPAEYRRTKVGFDLLLKVAADQQVQVNGKRVPALSRARLQSFYDGNLFHQIAAANRR